MSLILGILKETWGLYLEMAPYLIVGLAVAGVLYVVLPTEKVLKHLAGQNLTSTVKAALFGVPLPLCSCSVIPVATHLRRQGASRSSTLSFLISTPSTGVDSIMATYSLMGWVFTVARAIAAFFSGLVAGVLMNIFDHDGEIETEKNEEAAEKKSCCCSPKEPAPETANSCHSENSSSSGLIKSVGRMLKYAFVTLLGDIGWWLVMGIFIGGVISFVVPNDFVHKYLGNPLLAYPIMFIIGLPLYVCATGSIPIVAPLIMKGLAPGAALVFLIAGPASNTATMAVVAKILGRKALAVYIFSITFCAIGFGIVLDLIWASVGGSLSLHSAHGEMMPSWIKAIAGVVLLTLFINSIRPRGKTTAANSQIDGQAQAQADASGSCH